MQESLRKSLRKEDAENSLMSALKKELGIIMKTVDIHPTILGTILRILESNNTQMLLNPLVRMMIYTMYLTYTPNEKEAVKLYNEMTGNYKLLKKKLLGTIRERDVEKSVQKIASHVNSLLEVLKNKRLEKQSSLLLTNVIVWTSVGVPRRLRWFIRGDLRGSDYFFDKIDEITIQYIRTRYRLGDAEKITSYMLDRIADYIGRENLDSLLSSYEYYRSFNPYAACFMIEAVEAYKDILVKEKLYKYARDYVATLIPIVDDNYILYAIINLLLFLSFMDIRNNRSTELFAPAINPDMIIEYYVPDSKLIVYRDPFSRYPESNRPMLYLSFPFKIYWSYGIPFNLLRIYRLVEASIPQLGCSYTISVKNTSLWMYGRINALREIWKRKYSAKKMSFDRFIREKVLTELIRRLKDDVATGNTIGVFFDKNVLLPSLSNRLFLLLDIFLLDRLLGTTALQKLDEKQLDEFFSDSSSILKQMKNVQRSDFTVLELFNDREFNEYALLMKEGDYGIVQLVREYNPLFIRNVLFPLSIAEITHDNIIISYLARKGYLDKLTSNELYVDKNVLHVVQRYLRREKLINIVFNEDRATAIIGNYVVVLKKPNYDNDTEYEDDDDSSYDDDYDDDDDFLYTYDKFFVVAKHLDGEFSLYDLAEMKKIGLESIEESLYPVALSVNKAYPLRAIFTGEGIRHIKNISSIGDEVAGVKVEFDNDVVGFIYYVDDISHAYY